MQNLDWYVFQKIHALGTFNSTTEWVAVFLNYAGVAALLGIALLYAWRRKSYMIGAMFAGSAAAGYAVSRIIGFLYFRPRPFVTHNLIPLIHQSPLSKSFPSSHATAAFALAAMIYFYNKTWGRWALFVAAIVAFVRIVVGVHYPSDVFAGAAFGVLLSWLIRKFV